MDFSWSADQQALHERVRRFAIDELGPALDGAGDEFPRAAWRKAAEVGLPGLSISPAHGGLGCDGLMTARALEALGNGCADAGFGFALAAHLLACCIPIDRHGTEAQKARYLPDLCGGARIAANAISEPGAGSDAFTLETRAIRSGGGDGYVLTGEKTFVTNAPVADVFLVYAVTNPGRGPFSLSAFLIEAGAPGLIVSGCMQKIGLSTAQMGRVRLEECHVPACHRLGADGAGAAIFHESMAWERSCLFALWIGAMERQLAEVVDRAKTRRQFGRPIGANQAVSHRIADMKLRLESARLLLYRACWERSQARPSDLHASLAKLAVSEAFLQSSIDAVRIFGGAGVMRDVGIERYVRDALPSTIYSGTSDMQRELIARALGLPVSHRR